MREKFEAIAREHIKRAGIEDLLSRLKETDFYSAPASTKYHNSHEGGLVQHSLRVFSVLESDLNNQSEISKESQAIVALFHDLCKVGFYKKEMRNTKNEHGKWIQVPYYTVDDRFPYGHGEKSVYMIMQCMELTADEALAIRWHMGGFDSAENQRTVGSAFGECPLALHLHIADMKAVYLK